MKVTVLSPAAITSSNDKEMPEDRLFVDRLRHPSAYLNDYFPCSTVTALVTYTKHDGRLNILSLQECALRRVSSISTTHAMQATSTYIMGDFELTSKFLSLL